jgi:S1-C subfamily serine protease
MVSVDGETEQFEATVLATDMEHDLAIIQINYVFDQVVLIANDEQNVYPGDESYSIGFPHGFGRTLSRGYIRQLMFSIDLPDTPPMTRDAFMLRQRQEPGTSGAGIYSVRNGQLIALMSTGMWSGNHILHLMPNELVVPLRHIRPFLEAQRIPFCHPPLPVQQQVRTTLRSWLRLD